MMLFCRTFLACLVLGYCCAVEAAPKMDAEQRRAEIQDFRQQVLVRLFEDVPDAQMELEGAKGYAIFSNKGMNLLMLSTVRGFGILRDHRDGSDTYMKAFGAGAGVGAGLKNYTAVLIFDSPAALDDFRERGWELAGQADADVDYDQLAVDGGGAVSGALGPDVRIYQMTDKGFALQAQVQGFRYWADRELNDAGEAAAPPESTAQAADRVFTGGAVYTVDAQRSWATAVAVRDDRIVYVGDEAGAREWFGPETEVMDLAGQMMLPGFHDSHAHLLIGVATEDECDLLRLDTLERVRAELRDCRELAGFGPERWLIGSGWTEWLFENSSPDKALLDQLFPDRPVYLESSFGHSAWVNSRALALAGIGPETADPPQGIIVRDPESGEATGTLRDGAMMLVTDILPGWDKAYRMKRIRGAVRMAHSFGITALIEPGMDGERMAPLVELSDRGELNLRTNVSLSPIAWHSGRFGEEVFGFLEQREQWRREDIDVDGVKIYMDGVIESGTGYLLEPYEDPAFGRGMSFYQPEELAELFRRFDAQDLQIHVHAIGDAGVRMALDAFEAMRAANGSRGNRHHIVHLQLIDPLDVPRFAELDISATFQSLWAYPDPSVLELDVDLLGRERAWRMYPIGSVQRAGGRIVGGSDYFVTDLNPLEAIEVAVTRRDPNVPDGPVLEASERVDLATMIEAYTINGAWLMGRERDSGSIEVGKRADLVVLDRNLFEVPAEQINEARVTHTFFGGELVYSR